MTNQRVAVVFDNEIRPETTGLYCRRALGTLIEVEHIAPSRLTRIRPSDYELVLFVDDGLDYHIPRLSCPTAYWAIDTHLAYRRSLNRAKQVDFVFAAQQNGAQRLAEEIPGTKWLPLACDPDIHRPSSTELKYDVSFVGNMFRERDEFLTQLRRQFPGLYTGQHYLEDMAAVYSASRIVINHSVRDDINMRVFEAMACGALLITPDLKENGQNALFEPNRHLIVYENTGDAIDAIRHFLQHPKHREQIAAAGCDEVRSRHTYRERMREVLFHVGLGPEPVTPPVVSTPRPGRTTSATVQGTPIKDSLYFDHARPEILKLVPQEAERVLDIGCGGGRLGAAIRKRQSAHVTGIERDPAAADMAGRQLDRVLNTDVEGDAANFEAGDFDCVIMADVLEHLRHPDRALRNVARWLTEDGTLVLSIPNVRHHSVVAALLEGHFTYEAAGLLDEDHVRFFTQREIEKLLFRTGFGAGQLSTVHGPGDDRLLDRIDRGEVRLGRMAVTGMPVEEAREFYAYQYLITAVPQRNPDYGTTSIIILTHNELPLTKECLDSIRMRTDEPIELIVVDNGSTDGTVDYLRSLDGVKVVENETNLGFPAGVNQGLAIAGGENILLLNNDTVVTTGWLRRLLDCLHSGPDVGIVGPVSNNVSGEQQIDVPYADLGTLDGFAWDLGKARSGQSTETDRLVGFCFLFKQAVLDTIGLLDERFGIGCFEDDDYCRRARQAGFRLLIAQDAFVHHYGSQTFQSTGVDFAQVMRQGERLYREKWEAAEDKPHAEPTVSWKDIGERFVLTAPPAGGLVLEPKVIRVSLCMIVRDNEDTIGPCLQSIRPWVDEVIVVDTGSKDRTPEICRSYGARMFEFPWCDDFSAARNESVRHARGEWIFWMDSDDTITAEQGRQLRELAYGEHEEDVFGYIVQVHCPSPPDEQGALQWTVVDHVKLFRNLPELRFEHRIHEQIIPAIRRAGGDVHFTDLYVVHSGSDHSPETRKRKLERDYRILKLDLERYPDHPFVLFNLGMTYADDQKYEQARDHLERCLEVSGPQESHVRKAYALLTSVLAGAGDAKAAESACESGLELYPNDRELLFRRAMLHHDAGELDEAARVYETVLQPATERHFQSIDPAITGHKARHNLAIVYQALNRLADAERLWGEILEEIPNYTAAWTHLADLLAASDRANEIDGLAERCAAECRVPGLATCLKARALESRGAIAEAHRVLEAAIGQTSETRPLHELCRLLFERVSVADALPWLQRLEQREPENPQTLHNLGTALIVCGRFEEAIPRLRASLTEREEAAGTWVQLARALNESGESEEAVEACQRALDIDPTFHEAAELRKLIMNPAS